MQAEFLKFDLIETFSADCFNKFLHVFEPTSRRLWLTSVGNVPIDGVPGRTAQRKRPDKVINLELGFTLPLNARSIATPNGDIYLIGGIDPVTKRISDKLHKYNFLTNTLLGKKDMKEKRHSHAVCVLGNYIYVTGGLDSTGGVLAACERYDFENEIWLAVSPMIEPSYNHCLVPFKVREGVGQIFKVGGYDIRQRTSDIIQKYEEITNRWSVVRVKYSESPKMGSLPSAIQVNDKEILIFTGSESSALSGLQLFTRNAEQRPGEDEEYVLFPLKSGTNGVDKGMYTSQALAYKNGVYILQRGNSDQGEIYDRSIWQKFKIVVGDRNRFDSIDYDLGLDIPM